jgi:hypothetical protein
MARHKRKKLLNSRHDPFALSLSKMRTSGFAITCHIEQPILNSGENSKSAYGVSTGEASWKFAASEPTFSGTC